MSRVLSSFVPNVRKHPENTMTKKTVKQMLLLCRQSSSNLSKDEINTHKEELQSLLEREKVNLNHPRFKVSVPLCEACRTGNEWAVEVLLDHGANVNVTDKNKCTPVYIAASHGHAGILRKLLDKNADVNVQNLQGYFPLLSAIKNNHKETAKMLINAGADVNINRPNTVGLAMSLMSFVLFAKDDIAFAEELLKAGVCPHRFEKPLNFILLEFGDESREFIKKMVYAGFHFYCGGWIQLAQSKIRGELAEVSESEKDMIDFLEQEHCNPRSLKRLCRTAIRSTLVRSRVKCHIVHKIDELPLPSEVKKYLMLKYF